jgi:hypothetical protein
MISLIVFCVDKKDNKYQYSFLNTLEKRLDTINRSLKAQIDIHECFNIPNLVLLTNFDFQYKNIKAIDISDALCENNFWGNKYTLPLEYIKRNNINEDIWLHDYDCFPQEIFPFPSIQPNQIGAIFTGEKSINGGSLFIRKEDYDFFDTIKQVYDITAYHRSDEILLNDLFFNRQQIINSYKNSEVVDIFKKSNKSCIGLDKTYNYSFAMAKRIRSLDFIPKTLHFHPESIGQENCFKGKNIIKKEVSDIFESHFSEDLKKENEILYNKWRHPK